MNTPARFEPVPPLFLAERAVVHTSTRSAVSVNMSAGLGEPVTLQVHSQRMEMTVGEAGALLVRFRQQRLPAHEIARGMISSPR